MPPNINTTSHTGFIPYIKNLAIAAVTACISVLQSGDLRLNLPLKKLMIFDV
jgi:hypothetical protein